MKRNERNSGFLRYSVCILVALLIVSSVLVGAVFGKYTSKKQMSLDLSVEAYGEIELALCEGANAGSLWSAAAHSLYVAPGAEFAFDPYVLIGADSERCYLFISVAESGGSVTVDASEYTFSDFISYSVDSGWTRGDGANIPSNVYYRTVEKSGNDQFFKIITDDKVTCPENLTASVIDALAAETPPALTVTAYAVQITNLEDDNRDNATAEGAWAWLTNN